MSNVQSYNALIDRFKAFASGHFILKSFSHGQIDTADLEKFTQYPFMHVVPSNVTYAQGTKTFSFQIVLADLPRDKDDKVEFQREVLSDLQRIAEDLVAEITNHRVLFGDLITVQNVTLEPFLEEFHNTLTGWTVSLDLLVPYYWDACSIPAEWNDMFESSTGGTGSILSFVDSITRDENGNVSLVNDEANPAPHYYYGTNDEGVRGWYLLTDEVGLTCQTIGTCQTIIDIESAIDDLQAEILLKANTADLGAVAFSNDYNDLDNLPNLSGYGDMFKSVYDTDVDGVVDSAERIQIVVRNSTGSTLTKGQIVYLSGATGNRPNAVLAQANAELTSSKTIGMVVADIANNTDGQIAVNGTLHDLDTSAFTAGDTLWLSATTAGGMVANTPPAEPNHTVFIGYVARSHPNLGRIVLAIQNGYELDELHGVQITTPANNEVLTYESSSGLWKNKTANAGTVTSVAALTLGTTGTDLSSTVATGTTTPVITLNVPTASATNRGALSSADWSTFNGKFTLPSLTSGSVLFSNGTTIAQDNTNFFWDNTNKRLGIGTATPDRPLHVNSAGTTGIRIDTTGTAGDAIYFNNSTALIRWAGGAYFNNKGMYSGTSDQQYITFDGSSTQVRLQIKASNGNIGIGTTTDAGYKLDVNGTARFVSDIRSTTGVYIGTTATFAGVFPSGTAGRETMNVRGGLFPSDIGIDVIISNAQGDVANTTSNRTLLGLSRGFNPTSGSGIYNVIQINPTINQTGGASGASRGLYINPTLTSAFDFRAIEVASGITILGASTTAKASLRIPSGTAPTSPVNGDIWFDGTNIKMQIGGVTKTFTLI